MKKIFLGLTILAFLTSFQSTGQKITMRIPGVMDKPEDVTALEVEVEAESSWTKGGGASVGKPNPGHLRIKKSYSKAVAEMLIKIGTGKHFNEIVFEYFDQSSKPYYTITLTGAFVAKLQWLTPDCNNCPKLAMSVSFVYKTIKTIDVISGTTVTWDIPMGKVE